MLEQVRESLLGAINSIVEAIVLYVPKFIAGLIILLIGIIIASIVKTIILSVAKTLKFETFLKRYGVPELRQDYNWSNLIAEISRWFVIIIFLIPTADVWGLPRIGTLLNEVLLYLPNVFVAVVLALVGFVLASLAHDVILASLKGVSQESAKMIATGTQWAISIFVILAVLNQLGVASDLIRILFTGIVAMIAIAGGIAFGLGGQDSARQVLEEFKKRIK